MKNKIVVLIVFLLIPLAAFTTNTGNSLEKRILKLEKQLPTVSGKEKIDILNRLGAMTCSGAPKKCVKYCNQVLDLSKQIHYPIGKAKALIYLSLALSVLGDWEKPFDYCKEALQIYKDQRDNVKMGKALSTIGYLYVRIDDFDIALDYFQRSLQVLKKFGKKLDLYTPYWHLGNLYGNLEEYKTAIEYYNKAMDTIKELEKNRGVPQCLNNIGVCYERLGEHTRALEFYQQTLDMFEDIGDKLWIAASLSNIGRVHGILNHPRQALDYLSQARRIEEELGSKEALASTLLRIGEIYMKMKDYARARAYYDRAFTIVEKLEDKNSLEDVYKSYSNLYTALGDYKNAFENFKKYAGIRETLFNKEKSEQIARLEVRFEAEKRAKEIEILKKENEIQKISRNAFITGFFLVSIILILLFKKYLYLLAFWKKQKYIGQYRVIDTIGSGGMGTVYRAHTLRDKNQLAAVKVLREELIEDESSRKRFKQEGTIIDTMGHPNIVNVYERGEYKGKLYIAMEYLQGKTLAKKIKEEGKIDLGECVHIMIQITDALAFIHSKHVVHRDLNPANIMLIDNNKDGTSNVVKLLDFGVALMKFQTRLTQTGMLVGTMNYIAPEQITDNLYSPASDVYSLGITFYEMLIGKPAFTAQTITAVVEKILDETPEEPARLRPEIPGELNRLIMQMLSKEPVQRPSAGDVSALLINISSGKIME